MPRIVISGPAHAFAEDPRSSEPIADLKTLARFHGLASEETCTDTFDEQPLSELELTGGHLRFVVDPDGPALRITTVYHAPRQLTEGEIEILVEATKAQWSDGLGTGSFENLCGPVLSTALAMAILNTDGERHELGEYFVEALPLFGSEEDVPVEILDDEEVEKTDLDYLKESAGFGNPHAQVVLGIHLEDGDGVEKDERLAFDYYTKAAEQGHLVGLVHVGLCLDRGIGTQSNPQRGAECFTRAANEGLPLAMHCLGECYMQGRGVEANPDLGIEWYRRGVELGDMGCTAQLADCYEYGIGVAMDLHRALELYQRCMEGGFEAVEPALERLTQQLEDAGE